MILSVTLSKPVNNIEESLGKPYTKIKIRAVNTADGASYAADKWHPKGNGWHKTAIHNVNVNILGTSIIYIDNLLSQVFKICC